MCLGGIGTELITKGYFLLSTFASHKLLGIKDNKVGTVRWSLTFSLIIYAVLLIVTWYKIKRMEAQTIIGERVDREEIQEMLPVPVL